MIDYRDSLLSEIHELQQMLKGLPAEAVIQRISFENRLKGARKALEQESLNPTPSRVMLTFRGRPVDGSRGVAADFGGKPSGYCFTCERALQLASSANLSEITINSI